MSKTSQRKQAANDMGYQDAYSGQPVRFTKHPFLKDYKYGHTIGRLDRARDINGRKEPTHVL